MSAHILIVGCGAIGGLFASAPASVAKVTFPYPRGRAAGLPVPACRTVYRLVKGLERAAQRRIANPR